MLELTGIVIIYLTGIMVGYNFNKTNEDRK